MVCHSVLALLLAGTTSVTASFGLSAQAFQLSGSSSVNNGKLFWDDSNTLFASFQVMRSVGGSKYTILATTIANTYDDYNLSSTQTQYDYQVIALNVHGAQIDKSTIAQIAPFVPGSGYNTYDNTQPSSLVVQSGLENDGTYYQFLYESAPDGNMSAIIQQTSTDGYTFSGNTSLLNGSTVCSGIQYGCHLERMVVLKNPLTGNFVMWAHLENTLNYGLAQVAVAYGKPGKSWTFGGTFRPLGYDSRDITFWPDDNGDAYLVSAFDVNSNMNIYGLTSNWTSITKVVAEVYVKQYREAPAMAKENGTYYLFTSRAAGWYPSLPEYITAENIAGPWSNASVFANTATFSTQSGGLVQFNDGQQAMLADRWAANWAPTDGPNRQLMLPITFAEGNNYASSAFYATAKYNDAQTVAGRAMYGVQTGRIVSVQKPSSSNAGSTNITFANDGIQTNPSAYFLPNQVPFWYQIDLQNSYEITQVDLSTKMVQGSETYYGFNITGSNDGTHFDLLVDQSNNTAVGFVPSLPTSKASYRYIRLNVKSIINTHNGNSATWAAGIEEVTVYGK